MCIDETERRSFNPISWVALDEVVPPVQICYTDVATDRWAYSTEVREAS